jgi:hypothetical protein
MEDQLAINVVEVHGPWAIPENLDVYDVRF